MDYDLGDIDLEEKSLQPLENPFGPTVLLVRPVWTKKKLVAGEGFEPSTFGL